MTARRLYPLPAPWAAGVFPPGLLRRQYPLSVSLLGTARAGRERSDLLALMALLAQRRAEARSSRLLSATPHFSRRIGSWPRASLAERGCESAARYLPHDPGQMIAICLLALFRATPLAGKIVAKCLRKNGAPGTIRTSDPQIRSLMLYPAELRARGGLAFRGGWRSAQPKSLIRDAWQRVRQLRGPGTVPRPAR
jgi:hypothetical protein